MHSHLNHMPIDFNADMFNGSNDSRNLHTFPTRRSSDLDYTHLEAVGRLLTGIAPWLELGGDATPEGEQRQRYADLARRGLRAADRKSTRLNSSHLGISYAVFCLKKKIKKREMYVFI